MVVLEVKTETGGILTASLWDTYCKAECHLLYVDNLWDGVHFK